MSRNPLISACIALALCSPCLAQTSFDSGSTGSDGALSFAPNSGTIVFDPAALNLDADGDGVYHFTTITIPAGTTVRLGAAKLGEGRPVVWLASGAVTIAGNVDLNGAGGHGSTAVPAPSEAGAGGFAGGSGGTASGAPAQAGSGPGGGRVAAGKNGGSAAHFGPGSEASHLACAPTGVPYGNRFLLPLLGGSGGGGGAGGTVNGLGGGAGGGALLIASSVSIDLTGSIQARGGAPGSGLGSNLKGGGGSGGAVRLMAPDLRGTGTVDVSPFPDFVNSACPGAPGRIRLEAFRITGLTNAGPLNSVTKGRPVNVFLPANAPSVRISRIGTVDVRANPTGSYEAPDAVLNESSPVTLTIVASNIPLGTQVQVTLVPDDGTSVTLTSTALTGTLGSSTATVGPVQIPAGFSRFFVVATWSP